MNRIFFSFILFIATAVLPLQAQLITAVPPFPTDQQQVVITFNAAEGNRGLFNYTGDVYAHTGVITNLSTSGSDWKYVVSNWGVNIPKAKMTRDAVNPNLYHLTIGPSIRAYYGVPASETILKMAFVFRSGVQVNGAWLEGKTAAGGDIYYDVSQGGLNVSIIQPDQKQLLVEPGQQVAIQVASSGADSTVLRVNGVKVAHTSTSTLNYNLVANQSGAQRVKAFAYGSGNVMTDSLLVFVRPPLVTQALPEGVVDGINYISDNSVTLVLHAPFKNHVFVIGDFNQWEFDDSGYMKRTPDGVRYWTTITGLQPGVEYAYQYLVDGTLRIADPYTEKVLDPWNDQYIPASTYPNLKPYPTGKTTGIVSVLHPGAPQYQWEVPVFTPPAPQDLVIYELHIRDFVATRDIKTVIDTLDYLVRLGVNAIELMPINEFEGNDSWGYNPSFYFAADKAYGTKNDYKRFIDECHKRGIAVIIDMVYNHSFSQSPLVQLYYNAATGQVTSQNPWYNVSCPHPPYCWGFDFNHESQATRAFIDRANAYWINEYKVDGFRFDFTKGFTNRTGMNDSYDATRIANLKRMADQIWAVRPQTYVILEHFAPNNEESELAAYGMLIWGNLNHAYAQSSMGYVDGSNFSGISWKSRGWNHPHLVGYMESHDEERQMFKNLTYGNTTNANHNVKTLPVAVKRSAAAASMFLLVPGPKMIWQFGELGYDVSIDVPCRVCPKPIRWEYQQNWDRRLLFNYYKSLIALRKSHPVFSTADFAITASTLQKTLTLFHPDMSVSVVANFDVQPRPVNPQFYFAGKWYDYYSGDSIQVVNTGDPIQLGPGEFKVFTSKRLVRPSFVGLDETSLLPVIDFKVSPNPFIDQINVMLNLSDATHVRVELVNLFGQVVELLYDGRLMSGSQPMQLRTSSNIVPGKYFLRLDTGQGYLTRKVVKR
ncbi:MAG TPA: alpha-amylase family glycosyl hydrolase [Bacteroidales bacterium]|nr:alpha-amylase family glycosyl hydrolase [Bacteroidales bacterium]